MERRAQRQPQSANPEMSPEVERAIRDVMGDDVLKRITSDRKLKGDVEKIVDDAMRPWRERLRA